MAKDILDPTLTTKQRKFVDVYTDTGNGAEAARVAGYSKKNDRAIAAVNLTKVNIREAIRARMDAAGITEQRLLNKINEKLDAQSVKVVTEDGKIVDEKFYDDNSAQHKFLETAIKLRDLYPAERHEVKEIGEFDGWTQEELLRFAQTGERPDHE